MKINYGWIALLLILLMPCAADAKEIYYKDGRSIEGEILDEDGTYFYIEKPDGSMINVEKVKINLTGKSKILEDKSQSKNSEHPDEKSSIEVKREQLAESIKKNINDREYKQAAALLNELIEFEKESESTNLVVQLNQYALAQLHYCTNNEEEAVPVLEQMYELGLKEEVVFYYFWSFMSLYKNSGNERAEKLWQTFFHNRANSKKRDQMDVLYRKDNPSVDNPAFMREFCKAYL